MKTRVIGCAILRKLCDINMKILILNPCFHTLGGGEKYMIHFCQVLEKWVKDIEIDILIYGINGVRVDNTYPKIEALEKKFDISLSKTRIKSVKLNDDGRIFNRIRIYLCLKHISKKYDIFINWNFLSKQCGCAKKNIYFCMFPPDKYLYNSSFLKNVVKKKVDKNFVQRYDSFLSISEFTGRWLNEYWPEIDKKKIHKIEPPVMAEKNYYNEENKKNIILNVGRFFVAGHNKKQFEMLQEFLKYENQLCGYELHFVGSVSSRNEDKEYLKQIINLAEKSSNIFIHVNMNNEELKKLYSVAKIYWHATGMGMLETENPLEQEHFGITTVEAMNYGVVPVVVNQGGQPEIVQHGTDGFLWNDICECINYTKNLIENEEKRENMAKAAAISARRFSLEQFEKKLVHYLEGIFDAKENMER